MATHPNRGATRENSHLLLCNGTAVTVSDTVNIDASGAPYYALWVGKDGDVKLTLDGGDAVTLENVPEGTMLYLCFIRVWSTGTGASKFIAFR